MKQLTLFFLLIFGFSFAQQKDSIRNDSVLFPKFDLKLNESISHFEKIDLNVRIKHWDDETWEEKQRRKKDMKN